MNDRPKPIISLPGVKKLFPPKPAEGGARPGAPTFVVNGVDLDVSPGELLVLLGGSGCGKTTTLKMINRLEEPTEGAIHVRLRGKAGGEGEDLWPGDPVRLRRKIGYVIQGSGLFPHLTVGENVAVVPRLMGPDEWPEERIRARVDELLDLVGLPPEEFRDRQADKLSGGQAQRVGFARAVAAKPPVMLLDEPFGALDPLMREEVRQAFRAIRAREQVTAVMVTHDMSEAILMADRIAVMHDGKVVQWDTPEEVLRRPTTDYVRKFIQDPLDQSRKIEELLERAATGGRA